MMKSAYRATVADHQTLRRVGHCLYRSKESDVYYAILKRAGKQIKRSMKTTDKQLAKRRLADLQEKASRLNPEENGRISFEELGRRWLEAVSPGMKPSSHVRQVSVIGRLNKFFAKSAVRGITKQHVERWAAQRSPQLAPRTFNYERQTLIRILDYAMRDGLILENPGRVAKRLKQGKHQAIIPTKEQFKALLEAMRELRATAQEGVNLCELLAYSGCRLGEATAMKWGDVNFELKMFTVTGGERGTKNHEDRVVPLFPSLEQFLLRLRDSLPTPPQATDNIVSILNAKKALANACHDARLPHFTHHHLRHFFCSNAIEAGIDFKTIAGWLGHKDGGLLVAMTYGHLRDEHSAAMAKRMIFDAAADEPGNIVRLNS